MNTNSNRRPIYFSQDKDRDIIDYISPLLEKYNFSLTIRELIRDGIKYRTKPKEHNNYREDRGSPTTRNRPLQGIKLEEKEPSMGDIESRLDGF